MAPCPNHRTPKLLLSGLDSLHVSCYLDVSGSDLDFDELAHLKARVQASCANDIDEVWLGSEMFVLKPFGRYPYRFILVNDLFEISLAERLQPGCFVQLCSEGLWLFGLNALWGRFADWCCSLDLIATKPEVVSRAVWAFDYDLPFIDFEPNHFVSRADKAPDWSEHSKTKTFAFGKGDTVIRLYNKAAEVAQQSGKGYFYELWGQGEDVWRIEFQARNSRLSRSGIKTIELLKDRQNDLLRKLARVHTTLRQPANDTNKSRWPMHPLWKQLQRHIDRLPQTGFSADIDPKQSLNWRVLQQSQSIYGLLKDLAVSLALQGRLPEDPTLSEVIAELERVLNRQNNTNLWQSDFEKQLLTYQQELR